ncbi:hypothetical protein FQR65_LT10153 [Abscondita terminalis]|nr:hypothetical protein FQR65_LT10153 [Abscondita terminalis]
MWLYTTLVAACLIIGVHLADKSSSAPSDAGSSSSSDNTDDIDDYVRSFNWSDTFDWQLLKAVSKEHESNVLISPLSLKLALVVLYEGSEGSTKKEFQSVMQFPEKKAEIRKKYETILKELLNSRNDVVLNIGTRVFLDSSISPIQNYAATVKSAYDTDVYPTNFSRPKEAGDTINSWVDKLTDGHIKELINEGDIQEDALLVVANAMFFKGMWRNKFPKENTHEAGFYISPTDVVPVQYMSNSDYYYYAESKELDAKILRIPYKGKKIGFFIVLPNTKGGLPDLMKKANLPTMMRQLYILDNRKVDVIIPKFKFDFSASYTKILQDFGLTAMFSNTASFPGIARGVGSGTKWLFVNDLKQKSGIEINEEGSTAYAATEIQLGNKFGESDTVFNATHPFLYFLEHQETGTILFAGKMVNPLDSVELASRQGGDTSKPTPVLNENVAQHNFPSLNPVYNVPQENSISARFNFFDLELLQSFDDTRNYFISPASIKATLGMVLEGARGTCADEISRVLRIPADQTSSRERLSTLLYDFNSTPGTTLVESANGAFVSNVFQVVPQYERNLKAYYKADVRSVDFSNSEYAARLINNWVYNTTRGLITDIITPANFNSDATLVLANALYFQGKWKYPFDEASTSIKCFYGRNGCINARMMQNVDNYNYKFLATLDAEAIELPYGDGQYSMLVLLPSKQQSVDLLVRDIKFMTIASIVNMLEPTEVYVNLPKFEIEHTADIVPDLQRLGISEIFSPKANLSGIISRGQIKISNFVHKAKIEVNEKGTIAAGATGVIVIPLMGSSIPRFVADRPFLFFIYHGKTKNILFAGRLNEVRETYDDIFSKNTNTQTRKPQPPVNTHTYKQPSQQQNFNDPTRQRVNTAVPDNSQWKQPVRPLGLQNSAAPSNNQWKQQQELPVRSHASNAESEPKRPIYFNTDTVTREQQPVPYSSDLYNYQTDRRVSQ